MRRLIIVLSVFLLLAGGATASSAQDRTTSDENPVQAQALSFCSGGALKGFVSNVQNEQQTINERSTFLTVPNGGQVTFGWPFGSDTISVTLTGEADMTGVDGDDHILVQLRIDGVLVEPVGPVAFHTGSGQAAHSATWCKRVGPGSHTASVQARAVDVGNPGTVRGFLDDFVVRLERTD